MYQQQLKQLADLAIQCASTEGKFQREQIKQTAAEQIKYPPVYGAWLDLVEYAEATPGITARQAIRKFRSLLADLDRPQHS